MKYIKKIYENIETSIKSDNIWVVYSDAEYQIYEIYLKKEDADSICSLKNKQSNEYFGTTTEYYKSITLLNAIDLIKEGIKDDYRNDDFYNY